MKSQIFSALKLTFLCLILFSVIYPFSVWTIAQLAPNQGHGEVIEKDGRIVGFANVGQLFTDDKYFNSRPSAVNYNATGSGGSNKAPSNPDYLKDVQARIDTFLAHNPSVSKAQIPSELVTASGSGLDPDLSPQGAWVQIPRIAKTRGLSEEKIKDLVQKSLSKPAIGIETVNVLALNLALDRLK
ncbi:MAG: K(+)-transporting ATPase subunit C [Saprospiraceae bacterium]|nr:K(+)-transporting ATPase subunit C [Saprospiraceae bacterium]